MKFATFMVDDGRVRFGLFAEKGFVDLHEQDERMPSSMLEYIRNAGDYNQRACEVENSSTVYYDRESVTLLPPLPEPESFRDFMGFAEHHETCRTNRGMTVDPVYYQIPVFYFSNTKAIVATEQPITRPAKTEMLDFEFELAIIIGKEGRNIRREEADEYIFGYTILNDWSARDLQFIEMKVGLGPAKGKDFATSLGPYIVTKDEFEPFKEGSRFNRKTSLKLNGRLLRENNLNTIHHDFYSMIERASEEATLFPGDLIGSGTIGGGCVLEYAGENLSFLKSGDCVEMEIEGLGNLVSRVK